MSADLSPYALDPFGPAANPSAYVACEASERARAALERSLDVGRIGALVGPPGHGKTLLLRLLGGREEERARVAYVPFCKFEVDELFALVLNTLGVSRPGPPRDVLLATARELAPRGGIVILVDDANALSDACATALAALYAEGQGALRIGLAAVSGPDAQRVFRAFGSAIDVVQLADGMSGRESRRYVETRLAYGGARPELVAAFDDDTIEALHRASQGVPRRLNQVAQDVVRRAMRGALPSLREITGVASPAPVPIRPPAPRAVPPAPPPVHRAPPVREPVPAPVAVHREPPPATPRPPAPRVPPAPVAPPAPQPAAGDDLDDGRGILLPEIFDRAPGDPSGEYRLVRGRFVDAAAGGAEAEHRGAAVPQTVLVARPPERPAAQRRPPPRPSDWVRREPPARRGTRLPIRMIGIAGFALGVGVSMYWMTLRGTPVTSFIPSLPTPAPPTADAPPPAVAPPAMQLEPPPARRAPAPAIPEPKLEPVVPATEIEAAFPPERAPSAPATPDPVRVAVSINATPWAIVRVDGRELGETPLAGIELEPGPHIFQARMPDGSTREQTVEVTAERVTVVFE